MAVRPAVAVAVPVANEIEKVKGTALSGRSSVGTWPYWLIATALLFPACEEPKIGPQRSDAGPATSSPPAPPSIEADSSAAPPETITEPSPPAQNTASSGPQLPLKRNLINNQGRALKVEILAKRNGFAAVRKVTGSDVFSIEISTLCVEDQLFLATIDDSSAETVANVKQVIAPGNTAGSAASSVDPLRKARWNSELGSALAEAASTSLPIYFLFTGSTWCPPCKSLEAEVLSTSEFQTFADANLVLMKVDVPSGSAPSSARKMLEEYGVDSFPTVLLLSDERQELLRKSGFGNTPVSDYIESLRVAANR